MNSTTHIIKTPNSRVAYVWPQAQKIKLNTVQYTVLECAYWILWSALAWCTLALVLARRDWILQSISLKLFHYSLILLFKSLFLKFWTNETNGAVKIQKSLLAFLRKDNSVSICRKMKCILKRLVSVLKDYACKVSTYLLKILSGFATFCYSF